MRTNNHHPANTTAQRPSQWRAGGLAVALALALATVTACGPVGVHTYEAFASAVDHGASCHELFDMRTHFHRQVDLTKIDRDLARIRCTSANAKRAR